MAKWVFAQIFVAIVAGVGHCRQPTVVNCALWIGLAKGMAANIEAARATGDFGHVTVGTGEFVALVDDCLFVEGHMLDQRLLLIVALQTEIVEWLGQLVLGKTCVMHRATARRCLSPA